jgi:hypothetical protein
MADPLSITAGVVGLLVTCVKLGAGFKEIYDGAAIADTAVQMLVHEIESFEHTLEIMNETLSQPDVQLSIQSTGHLGNHWSDVSKSIEDGKVTLAQLLEILQKVDKTVSVLGGARKHFRLKGATGEIARYQRQIKAYKDTMQLSMQTMVL